MPYRGAFGLPFFPTGMRSPSSGAHACLFCKPTSPEPPLLNCQSEIEDRLRTVASRIRHRLKRSPDNQNDLAELVFHNVRNKIILNAKICLTAAAENSYLHYKTSSHNMRIGFPDETRQKMNLMPKTSQTIPREALSGAQSIHRAIAVLRVVAQYTRQGVRLSKVAQKLGLHTATVHRMLSVFVKEQLVTRDPVSKLYQIGLELYSLGAAAPQLSIRDKLYPALERIAEKTGDTCHLALRSGNDAVCIDRVVGKYPVQVLTLEVGERRPLGIGASSLAILACLPKDEIETIFQANRLRYRGYKFREAGDVARAVDKSRQLGYGLSDRVVTSETIGVGVAVKDRDDRVVGAISVAGIMRRMGQKRQKEIVVMIKSEIKAMGFFCD
jgi:DNA-binding IclR family transcriptional regulator